MRRRSFLIGLAGLGAAPLPAWRAAAAPSSRFIEDLTWIEVRDAVAAGAVIAIVPTGGTEQNGPQMAIGKHNVIVRYTAGEIAARLGNALVAPVLAYVPEGSWDPPEGHMRFPGSISLPDKVYEQVLESTVRSFAAEGFKAVVFLGDSGPNQKPQEAVAKRLTAELKAKGVRVIQAGDYYSRNGQEEWLKSQGFTDADIGVHAHNLAQTHEETRSGEWPRWYLSSACALQTALCATSNPLAHRQLPNRATPELPTRQF